MSQCLPRLGHRTVWRSRRLKFTMTDQPTTTHRWCLPVAPAPCSPGVHDRHKMISCRKHFTPDQFYPTYDTPVTFIACQWQHDKTTPNVKYFVYRVVIALTFFISWLLSLVLRKSEKNKWAIFLTNWGYTLCTLQAVLSCAMLALSLLAVRVCHTPKSHKISLKLYPVYWILFTIATPLAFGITLMYWTVLYSASMGLEALNFFVHAANSILMFIDLWMISHPIRILHFVYPLALGLVYMIFSIIYYAAGGTGLEQHYIYPILDWANPLKTSLICLGVIALLVILHLFTFFLCKLRELLHGKIFSKKMDSPTKTELQGYDNAAMANENV